MNSIRQKSDSDKTDKRERQQRVTEKAQLKRETAGSHRNSTARETESHSMNTVRREMHTVEMHNENTVKGKDKSILNIALNQ